MALRIALVGGCIAALADLAEPQDARPPTLTLPAARAHLVRSAPYWEVPQRVVFASGGDADGDGTRDVIVSNREPAHESDQLNSVSVRSGRDGHLITTLGGGPGFGSVAAFADDLDGDGRDDLLVTRQSDGGLRPDGAGGHAAERSRIEAYSSASGQLLYQIVEPPLVAGSVKTILGVGAWLRPGEPRIDIELLSDLDEDGIAEVAWSFGRYERGPVAGRITIGISSGKDGSPIRTHDIDVTPADWGVAHLANLHDVDGDGVDDLGALIRTREPSDLLVFSGATGKELLGIRRAGTVLAAAGDVDGDGRGDMLIANEFDAMAPNDSSTVVLVSGATGLTRLRFRLEVPADGAMISLAGLGDTNGDRHSDFAVGCPLLDLESREGRPAYVHIVSGFDGSILQTLAGSLEDGTGPLDLPGRPHAFGFNLAPLGDVDGDGLSDLAVSEDRYFNSNAGFGVLDRLMVFRGRR